MAKSLVRQRSRRSAGRPTKRDVAARIPLALLSRQEMPGNLSSASAVQTVDKNPDYGRFMYSIVHV